MAKVSDLEGVDLDCWVARAMGHKARLRPVEYCEIVDWNRPGTLVNGNRFQPSTDWTHGGPIIERELISAYASTDDKNKLMYWVAVDEKRPYGRGRRGWLGPTPLIAAMRAFVASKYGDETPEEHHDNQD